jgi:hypothetical protein
MNESQWNWPSEAVKDKLIVGLIGALVGTGIGGGASYFRVDKFTGAEGTELDKRISALERNIYKLPPDWLKEKVTENSIKIRHIDLEIQRIQKEHTWFWSDFSKRHKRQ